MFKTPKFETAFWNTIKISVYQILVESPITVIFALLLNIVRNKAYRKTVQMVTYMPHFI